MIHFGFSYIGLIFLLMLFIPNILWAKHKPKDYEKYVKNEATSGFTCATGRKRRPICALPAENRRSVQSCTWSMIAAACCARLMT